jgi:ArsR family transcriptional regulator
MATKARPRVLADLPLATPSQACCAPGVSEPMSRENAEDLSALLKAVADPARLQLISLIRASANCEACVCDLTDAMGLSQPTISHHLRILTAAGVLTREQRGTWAWFTLNPRRLKEISRLLI